MLFLFTALLAALAAAAPAAGVPIPTVPTSPTSPSSLSPSSSSSSSLVHFGSQTFDNATMWRMIYVAAAAYCAEDASLQSWTCPSCRHAPGFNVTASFATNLGENFAFVAYDLEEERIVVSFRGSSNIPNWIQDLDFELFAPFDDAPDIQVHRGFWFSYHTLQRTQTRAAVQELLAQHPNAPITVTGHSMGAAQSVFAAADLAVTFPNSPVDVINYGLPRTGNKAWAEYVVSKVANTVRVVNEADIVPHVPLIAMGFHHVPLEAWWHKGGIKVCDGSGEDGSCSDSRPIDLSVQDHVVYLGGQVPMNC